MAGLRSRSSLVLTLGALLPSLALAAAPHLYDNPTHQSPVRASGDDLLLLPGLGFTSYDTVVYQDITGSSTLPAHPGAPPVTSNASTGIADVVSVVDAPYSLAVRLPAAVDSKKTYVLWVMSPNGEWSNGVRINDARPIWITPSYIYASSMPANLPRILKVVGRNLNPIAGQQTLVRLVKTGTHYTLPAYNVTTHPADTSEALDRYVALVDLPASVDVGVYSVDVSRDGGSSWVQLLGTGIDGGQTLEVKANPSTPTQYNVASYGSCTPGDGNDDTPCIINAIEAAFLAGGGDVVLGAGVWDIAGGCGTHVCPQGGHGIIVGPGVNLKGVGATGASPTIIRRGTGYYTGQPIFSLQTDNTVSGIRFQDATLYTTKASDPGTALRVGITWYHAKNYKDRFGQEVTHVSNVIITQNVFDKPYQAIVGGSLPTDHLFITGNTFGAFENGVYFGRDRNNPGPYEFSDIVVSYNNFNPGSFLDVANAQGTIASQVNTAKRMDLSYNLTDGSSTTYLNPGYTTQGFRGAHHWSTGEHQEMVLASRNTILCSGDLIGDGESLVLDSDAESEGFSSALPVLSAVPWAGAGGVAGTTVTFQGAIRTSRQAESTIADLSGYYKGAWVRIVQGPGIGQWRRVDSLSVGVNTITVNVQPALDVLPQTNSLGLLGRGAWQALFVDNTVDQRAAPGGQCTKGNLSRKEGGTMSFYATVADSVIEGNEQYDTGGILLAHQYFPTGVMIQSSNEIRNNLVDGEYAWDVKDSYSGIVLGFTAPTTGGPPPVTGFGTTISHNTIRQADYAYGYSNETFGALALTPAGPIGPESVTGQAQWKMSSSILVFNNSLNDIVNTPGGATLPRLGIGLSAAAPYHSYPMAWHTVLYGNSCNNVAANFSDFGMSTVRQCTTGSTNCECGAAEREMSIGASASAYTPSVGSTVTYTATVTNNDASGSANGVDVTIEPPSGINVTSISSSTATCYLATRACRLTSMTPLASATITVTGTATASGTQAMQFTVSSQHPDPDVTSNGFVVNVTVP